MRVCNEIVDQRKNCFASMTSLDRVINPIFEIYRINMSSNFRGKCGVFRYDPGIKSTSTDGNVSLHILVKTTVLYG